MSCWSELIWVNWSTIWDGSMGFNGSWACNCAVRSVMNEFGPNVLLEVSLLLDDGASCVLAAGGRLLYKTLGMVMGGSPFLAASVQARTLSLPLESKISFKAARPVCGPSGNGALSAP